MILPAHAPRQRGRRRLPVVLHDSVLLGARFARIKADFDRVYPRPVSEQALAGPLSSPESAVMAFEHCIAAVTLSHTNNPKPGMLGHRGRLEHQLLHHRLDGPALGAVARRRIRLFQGVLPN